MAMLRQLELIAQDIDDEDDVSQKAFLIRLGALIAILTAASLRGHEGFYLDIAATRVDTYLDVPISRCVSNSQYGVFWPNSKSSQISKKL
jgi:hypothetical protein